MTVEESLDGRSLSMYQYFGKDAERVQRSGSITSASLVKDK
jgi:hypothetical protein